MKFLLLEETTKFKFYIEFDKPLDVIIKQTTTDSVNLKTKKLAKERAESLLNQVLSCYEFRGFRIGKRNSYLLKHENEFTLIDNIESLGENLIFLSKDGDSKFVFKKETTHYFYKLYDNKICDNVIFYIDVVDDIIIPRLFCFVTDANEKEITESRIKNLTSEETVICVG